MRDARHPSLPRATRSALPRRLAAASVAVAAARAAAIPGARAARPAGRAATALAAALLFGAAGAAAAPPQLSSEGPWAKGRVLVVVKPGLSVSELGKIAGAEGGKANRIGKSSIYVIDLPPQASETAVRARLRGNPHIESVEFDEFVPLNSSNDPYAGSQWHLPKMRAVDAWADSAGTGITVAIVDTGVQSDHPDLKDRMVAGYNFYDGNTNTADVHSHGTQVAGTAAATLNNGLGVASVSGQSKIMPIRVTDSSGYASFSNIAKAITFAADKGARVANVSIDASGSSTVANAAQYMKDRNGLVFIGAGNSGKDPGRTDYASFIVVSATNSSDVKTSWSNYGANVDLAAPGAGIYTTTWGSGYASVSGTSFSSPNAAAVAALVMAANSGLKAADVEKILYATAVDLGSAGKDTYYGHGRVDAYAAVQAALNTVSSSDTTAPKVAVGSPTGGSTVSGLTTVDVSASDNVGVAKVELWVKGSLLATDTTSPYSFSWDTTKVADGSASLAAKAFDAAGNEATSSSVSVNVSNGSTPADTTPPTTGITNPTDGSTVAAGTIKVQAGASDNAGVSGIAMTLSINGKQVASSSGTGIIDYGWNTRRLKSGTYALTVTARDAAGNSSSHSISVKR